MSRGGRILSANLVPLLFLVVSLTGIFAAGIPIQQLLPDVLERFSRNLFLVLSLVIPIVAGLGLNFAIVLGAMAGQIGLMVVQNGRIEGLGGLAVAVICSIPIATALGWLTGRLFNRAKGREMVTGIILGFFAAGVYRLVFLVLAGPVIPLHGKDLLLPQGVGLRVTINLTAVERSLDDLLIIPLRFGGSLWGEIPVVTLAVCALLCVGIVWFFKTKLGQDLRAVGQEQHVSGVAGIRVDRCRVIAIILSMAAAGIGQIIWLQNMTVMNTFQSHEQVGFYAIAALLVGGATVSRVTIWNAILGTILFHTLFVVIPVAAQEVIHSAQIGEFFREFLAFTVIGASLAIHAWRSRRPG
ncbi:MAG: ABC transporter permease subunit [Planctomycetota bacterium]|jgi:simple sugar transport system permease protein